jgi:hypothetical protein
MICINKNKRDNNHLMINVMIIQNNLAILINIYNIDNINNN